MNVNGFILCIAIYFIGNNLDYVNGKYFSFEWSLKFKQKSIIFKFYQVS